MKLNEATALLREAAENVEAVYVILQSLEKDSERRLLACSSSDPAEIARILFKHQSVVDTVRAVRRLLAPKQV